MSTESTLLWIRYRSATKELTWHGWRKDEPKSVCGHLRATLRTNNRIKARSEEIPPGEDHTCAICLRKLGLPARKRRPEFSFSPGEQGNVPIPHRVDQPSCACDYCRPKRKKSAEEFANIVNGEVERISCACVQDAMRENSDTQFLVEAVEANFRARLLLWELCGTDLARIEAYGARSLVLDLWRLLATKFEREGNWHSCGVEARGT